MNGKPNRWMWIALFLGASLIWIVACNATPEPTAVQPTEAPATVAVAEPTETPAPTETPSLSTTPDPALGQQLWTQKPCSGCHGAAAQGDIGPKLAGTDLDIDQVLLRVREGKGAMPAFDEDQVSDLEVQHIYAWLFSLAPLAD